MIDDSFGAHVPISFLLLATVTIFDVVHQIRLRGHGCEALPVDAHDEAVCGLLPKGNATDSGLNSCDIGIIIGLTLIARGGGCGSATAAAVAIDNIDDHEVVVHLIEHGLLLLTVAYLRVITAASAPQCTLHSVSHSIRPLHSTDETVVHGLAGRSTLSPSLHTHDMQCTITLLEHLLLLLLIILILISEGNAIHRCVSLAMMTSHGRQIIFSSIINIRLGRHIVYSVQITAIVYTVVFSVHNC